ncbi:MAG: hypothetical protein ACRC1K_01820, partial [Planctomycetia bacterium]
MNRARRRRASVTVRAAFLALLGSAVAAVAQSPAENGRPFDELAAVLPADAAFLVVVEDGARWYDALAASPPVRRLADQPIVAEAARSPGMQKLKQAADAAGRYVDLEPAAMARGLFGRCVVFALLPPTAVGAAVGREPTDAVEGLMLVRAA